MKVHSDHLVRSLFEAVAFCYFLDERELHDECCMEFLDDKGIEYDEDDCVGELADEHGLEPSDIREYIEYESNRFYDWHYDIVADPIHRYRDEDGMIDLEECAFDLFDRIVKNIKKASKSIPMILQPSPLDYRGMGHIACCIANEDKFYYTKCDMFGDEDEKEYVIEKLEEYCDYHEEQAKRTA